MVSIQITSPLIYYSVSQVPKQVSVIMPKKLEYKLNCDIVFYKQETRSEKQEKAGILFILVCFPTKIDEFVKGELLE